MYFYIVPSEEDAQHHGVLGMKWGIRRYQPYSVVPRGSGKKGKEIGEAAKRDVDSVVSTFSNNRAYWQKYISKGKNAIFSKNKDKHNKKATEIEKQNKEDARKALSELQKRYGREMVTKLINESSSTTNPYHKLLLINYQMTKEEEREYRSLFDNEKTRFSDLNKWRIDHKLNRR